MAALPDDLPEPDIVEGAPHPRHSPQVFGQGQAEAVFLDAWNAGRMHHAWLISGPRGVGKATLAWKIAAFVLSQDPAGGLFGAAAPPSSLATDPEDPVRRRLAAITEPGFRLVRRGWDEKKKDLKTQLTVDEVRKLREFFQLSATDGKWRVVIVDSADEMNVQAANALLKSLEEPPKRTLFLIVCHQPSRLLPTIRSRCRALRCGPLSPDDLARALQAAGQSVAPDEAAPLATLAAGSAGEAIRLLTLDGLKTYASLIGLMTRAPGIDRLAALALSEGLAGRKNADRLDILLVLFDLFLSRLARAGIAGPAPEGAPGEAALMARLCPDQFAAQRWADLHQHLGQRARHGKAVNLDPGSLILDMVLKIDEAALALAAA